MKKINYYFIVIFCCVLYTARSNDEKIIEEQDETEQTEEEEVLPPSNFTLNVEPSFKSVIVTWTVGELIGDEQLSYTIYLDGELKEDELTELFYVVEDLEFNSSYSLRVEAKNTAGITSEELSFETLNPENYSVRVDSIKLSQDRYVKYNYDQNLRLEKVKYKNINQPYDIFQYNYFSYDNDGDLTSQLYKPLNYPYLIPWVVVYATWIR